MSAILRSLLIAGVLSTPFAFMIPQAHAQTQAMYQFDLPEQPLADALRAIARQTGANVLFESKDLRGIRAPALQAQLTTAEAIERVLAGTDLQAERTTPTTVVIQPRMSESSAGQEAMTNVALRLAQADASAQSQPQRDQQNRENTASSDHEVVVTGTQIRGATSIASPITVVTREDIDRSGTGSVQRYIQNLPENFKGGASEGTAISIAGGGSSVNVISGTAFNLRGLGNDSTLTLLNGRRFAPNNYIGNFVDVSLIPVAAIERVEIVPDGASALYGSDAVGGVVNFVMKQDYDGAEARARYGKLTEGGLSERQISATGGLSWSGGSALLSYEYFGQEPLDLNDKDWVRNKSPDPFQVLAQLERNSVFAGVTQSLGNSIELFGNAIYSDKDVPESITSAPGFFVQNYTSATEAYDLTAGIRAALGSQQELELVSSYGESDTTYRVFQTTPTQPVASTAAHSLTGAGVFAVDAKVSGPLLELPAGPLSYATGAHYRTERIRRSNVLTNVLSYEGDRSLWAAFGELSVPLARSAAGRRVLELTVAGRYEDYDDFGDTFNPKLGLIYSPSADFRMRGTWGTSFKAPLLNDLNPVHSQVAVSPIFDPTVNGNVQALFVYGGSPGLVPEEATSWTVGADWTPQSMPSLKARLTFYDIQYDDRMTNPQLAFSGVVPSTNADPLRFESLLSRFITRNPTPAQIQALIANTTLFSDFSGTPGGVNLADVRAIVDYRIVNLSSVQTRGLDFGISGRRDLGAASLELGVDATYILDFDNKLAPGVPVIEAVSTVFNPVDLKLRARAILSDAKFTAALYVNYIDSYEDMRNSANVVPVSSWTTLDLNVGYAFDQTAGLLSDFEFSVGATNLTDAAPPYVAPSYSAYGIVVFDGANHDLRGRMVYGQLSKRF